MSSATLFHLCLIIHIIGFAAISGGILADFIIHRRLEKYFNSDRQKAIIVLESASGIFTMITLGGIPLILSGVGMMALTNGAFGEMLWFRIKIVFVALIVLNVIIIARPNFSRLRLLLKEDDNQAAIDKTKNTINGFLISQIIMLLIIVGLSVFQF